MSDGSLSQGDGSCKKALAVRRPIGYFVNMRKSESWTPDLKVLKALASPVRLAILEDLKDPTRNYPPQVDGDPVEDGICADFIRERLGLAPATASRHLSVLAEAALVIPTRKRGWTFFRRDEEAIRRFVERLGRDL